MQCLPAFLLVVAMGLAAPYVSAAQSVDDLNRLADEAAARGLPAAPLTNKIREGLAKGAQPQRIEVIVRQMTAHLQIADRLIREVYPASARPGRDAAVTLLAESFGTGATVDEVRELHRQAQTSGRPPLSADGLAGGEGTLVHQGSQTLCSGRYCGYRRGSQAGIPLASDPRPRAPGEAAGRRLSCGPRKSA